MMIQLPEKLSVLSEEENKMTFELSPLYPGYGVTVGNALRRVLLSSIGGSAITTVKIKGVSHEFSSIEGVLENVIEIIMNIKKIRLRSYSDEPVTMELKVSGEKEAKAKDIKAPSGVEIINKDQLIATLTDKKAELEIEVTVERGIGYVPIEQRQKEKISVGTIAIDALFSPVINANFTVENIRVGQRTDYNKLVFEVETDGIISPREAVSQGLDILAKHLEIIGRELGAPVPALPAGRQVETESAEPEETEEKSEKKTKKKSKK